jgi:hypothetical protein
LETAESLHRDDGSGAKGARCRRHEIESSSAPADTAVTEPEKGHQTVLDGFASDAERFGPARALPRGMRFADACNMELLHRKKHRVVDGSLRRDANGAVVLVAEGNGRRPRGDGRGLTLVDATDAESRGLVASGYALPSGGEGDEGTESGKGAPR